MIATKSEKRKRGHDATAVDLPIDHVCPARFNDLVYGAIDPNDGGLDDLVKSMGDEGQLEPIVVTLDNVVLSGHRRLAAAKRLGWKTIKARHEPIESFDAAFERKLVSYNAPQRDKTPDQRVREQLVLVNPDDAFAEVVSQRAKAVKVKMAPFVLDTSRRKRSKIGRLTKPFLDAVTSIVFELESEWPIGERSVHYKLAMLADPPLTNANRPGSVYKNDLASSKKLSKLVTKARLEGYIPFEAICDETRPVESWGTHANVAPFIADQVENFATGYWRNLQQGQPNHIEIVGEKLTIQAALRSVAAHYCIPYTIGRGYSSLPPRRAMFERFKASGGKKLVILFVCDHDPEGQNIPQSFAHSMKTTSECRMSTLSASGSAPSRSENSGYRPASRRRRRAAATGGSERNTASSRTKWTRCRWKH